MSSASRPTNSSVVHALACSSYMSTHSTNSSRHAFQKVRPCHKQRQCSSKTGYNFVLSLSSTRVSFRGLREAAPFIHEIGPHTWTSKTLHLQDGVHLARRVRLAHRHLISASLPVVPSHSHEVGLVEEHVPPFSHAVLDQND